MSDLSLKLKPFLVVTLITFIGAALRFAPAGESLWLDELHTAWTVMGSDGDLAARAQLGNNSPVYFWCVRIVTQVWGTSESSLRLLSLLAGTILVPLTFFVCRSWRCSIVTSLLAAALVAIDRHANFYACEARPYALVQLLALMHLAFFSRLLSKNDGIRTWIPWVLTGMAMFQVHCTSALFIAAEAVALVVLMWIRIPLKTQSRYLLVGFAVIAVSMVSSVNLLQVLAERRENWSHFIHASRQPLRMLWLYPLHVYLLAPTLAIGAAWLVKSRLGGVRGGEPKEESEEQSIIPILLCVSCLFLPVVAAWLLTEWDITRLFLRRYLIASSVTLAPLSAIIISAFIRERRIAWWISLAVLGFGLVAMRPGRTLRVQEDWKAAIPAINSTSRGEPLILYSGLIEADPWWNSTDPALLEYCGFPLHSLYPLDEQRRIVLLPRTIADIDVSTMGESESAAWLLIRSNERKKSVIAQAVLASLGPDWLIQQQITFGRLTLLKLSYATNSPNE